jgi:hypothetical protein
LTVGNGGNPTLSYGYSAARQKTESEVSGLRKLALHILEFRRSGGATVIFLISSTPIHGTKADCCSYRQIRWSGHFLFRGGYCQRPFSAPVRTRGQHTFFGAHIELEQVVDGGSGQQRTILLTGPFLLPDYNSFRLEGVWSRIHQSSTILGSSPF